MVYSVLVKNVGMKLSEKLALTQAASVKLILINSFIGDGFLVS
jgi:hypothetical protein